MTQSHLIDHLRVELAKAPWRISAARIYPDARLSQDLSLDSLDIEELLLALEPRLRVELVRAPDSMVTIADLITHLQTHLPTNQPL